MEKIKNISTIHRINAGLGIEAIPRKSEPLAHTQSKLKAGSFYSVCHAIISHDGKTYYVPVSPLKHKDPQFGGSGALLDHCHIDGRFPMDKFCKDLFDLDSKGRTNSAVFFGIPQYTVLQLVYIRARCIRKTTGVKPPKISPWTQGPSNYMEWYNSMIGKSCAGKKCPHYGTTMIEEKGKLICPLHNLTACAKTEQVIPLT